MPVELADIKQLRRALAKYDPALYKAMNIEIRGALKDIQKKARALVPETLGSGLRNFSDDGLVHKGRVKARAFPRFNSAEVKKGIVIRTGASKRNANGFVSYYSLNIFALLLLPGRHFHPQVSSILSLEQIHSSTVDK